MDRDLAVDRSPSLQALVLKLCYICLLLFMVFKYSYLYTVFASSDLSRKNQVTLHRRNRTYYRTPHIPISPLLPSSHAAPSNPHSIPSTTSSFVPSTLHPVPSPQLILTGPKCEPFLSLLVLSTVKLDPSLKD